MSQKLLMIGIFSLIAVLTACRDKAPWPEITATQASPDRKFIVEIRENVYDTSDRHFRVVLIYAKKDNLETVLFESPDEGTPSSERILWSRNSESFVITGFKFGVIPEAVLPDRNCLYLLYDINKQEIYCNSNQEFKYPRFTPDDLKFRDFPDLPNYLSTN